MYRDTDLDDDAAAAEIRAVMEGWDPDQIKHVVEGRFGEGVRDYGAVDLVVELGKAGVRLVKRERI